MSVFRRQGSPFFQYAFTLNGIRHRGSTGAKTKTKAQKVESDRISKATQGQLSERKKVPTLKQFADIFTEYLQTQRRSHGTKLYYQTGIKTLMKKELAATRVDRITKRDIETTPFNGSGSHINCALRTLNRMLHLAEEWGYIQKVPKIVLARERRRTATFNSDTEQAFLSALPQPWNDVFLVMLDAGMRNQEAVAIRWEDIDWEKHTIYNERVKADDTEGWVPMSDRLKVALLTRLQTREGSPPSPWVFPATRKTSKSGHISPNVSRSFSKVRREKKLPASLTPYSARHTYGTDMMALTGNIAFVGKLLGHRSLSTTARYLHPDVSAAKALIDRRNQTRSCTPAA